MNHSRRPPDANPARRSVSFRSRGADGVPLGVDVLMTGGERSGLLTFMLECGGDSETSALTE